ncbi:MAG: DsbA family protein [Oscillospiraceae bacterium]|nr:DsbA family protein [Oscillospiraceae bacterium]
MQILFVSDYVCPYCLVAKEALKQALAETGMEAEITWQPYELTPESRERVDTWHDEKRRANYQILVEPCARLGLDMKLPPHVIPRPYTRLAFEGWFYACEKGRGEEYNDLVYRAYFVEEQDIGEPEVLAGLARRVGLDADDFAAALQNGSYTAAEKEAVAYARNVLKPQGVPTVYINGEKISVREYTKEEMIAILRQEADKDAGPGFSCGDDGCGFSCGEDGCGMA